MNSAHLAKSPALRLSEPTFVEFKVTVASSVLDSFGNRSFQFVSRTGEAYHVGFHESPAFKETDLKIGSVVSVPFYSIASPEALEAISGELTEEEIDLVASGDTLTGNDRIVRDQAIAKAIAYGYKEKGVFLPWRIAGWDDFEDAGMHGALPRASAAVIDRAWADSS